MRLALVLYGDLNTLSGGYLYDRLMINELRRLGDTVEVISLPSRSYGRQLADNFNSGLRSRLQDIHYDALLQDELHHPAYVWANRRLRAASGRPIVTIVHHLRSSEARPAWQNKAIRQIEKAYLQSVDGFLFNTATTRHVVGGVLGEEPPGSVAYPGRDHVRPSITEAQIAERARSLGPKTILFVANLIPRKGLHTLLKAASRLPRSSWTLDVVGSESMDPGYARRVRRQVEQLGMTDRVRFLGALSGEAVAAFMKRSHILAVPSDYEGFGIAYLEGMGHGLAPIASARGGARELVEHGQNGFLVQPDDPRAVASALESLLGDPERLTEIGLAARRRFEAHPTWRESALEARAFLLRMLGKEAAVPDPAEGVQALT